MSLTLTPAQQAALDKFDAAADKARTSADLDDKARTDLTTAQENAAMATEQLAEDQSAALEAAQEFVDLMLSRDEGSGTDTGPPPVQGGTVPGPTGHVPMPKSQGTVDRPKRPV